jgi:predicted O-methyltransferase YrrM
LSGLPSFESRGITTEPVEKYLYRLLKQRDNVLAFLEKGADEKDIPIIGPVVGNFLSLLATSCAARNILEIGTATGYSGIWLGRVAKQNGGKLTTIEMDPSRAKIASKSFYDADLADSIELVIGDARKEVPRIAKTLTGKVDFVFIDVGEKSLYVDLLEDCVKVLRVGGYLTADNTLWTGKVASSARDRDTTTLREYNKRVYSDERLLPSLVPIRDGVTIALKLKDK